MSFTRSIAIVELVRSPAGVRRRPAARRAGLAVDEVLADQRLRTDLAARVLAQVGQAGSVTSTSTIASGRPSTFETLNLLVLPARTPATLKSPPSVSPKALSKSSW